MSTGIGGHCLSVPETNMGASGGLGAWSKGGHVCKDCVPGFSGAGGWLESRENANSALFL